MALRTKTIEYAIAANNAALGTAVNRVYPNTTVYIPETTSRTFRSVVAEFNIADLGVAAASITAVTLGVQIGTNAANTYSITTTVTNSGEAQAYILTKDYTQYFQNFFTGTSQVVGASTTITGPTTINSSGKLIITYEYDDSATTRIKTVKIPIEGANTALTTANADFGGIANQIPNLSTFLPEASKVYRNIFFETFSHTGTTAAANSWLGISYNGVEVQDSNLASTLISDIYYPRIDDVTAIINTAAVNSLQARVLSITGRPHNCLSGVLNVTYEYNHSTSTSIINSIQQPLCEESGLSGTLAGDKSRFTGTISVQEPGPISLVQSGVLCSYQTSGATTVDFRVGSQTTKTFTHAATVNGGSKTHLRRIDSGAPGGAGITLTRGDNPIILDWFSTTATATSGTVPSNFSAMLYLNYTSGKHALGDGVHNHTINWCTSVFSSSAAVANGAIVMKSNTTPIIPETYYWISSTGFKAYAYPTATASFGVGYNVGAQILPTEDPGAGWASVYNGMAETDSENGIGIIFARSKDTFKQYPSQPSNTLLNIQSTRSYRYETDLPASATVNCIWQMQQLVTYHAITSNVNIVLSNVPGSSNVIYGACRESDKFVIGYANTMSGNGTYTLPWYDNTANVVVYSYVSGNSTYSGVGPVQNTSTSFSIDLAAPGGSSGGPTYYAYV